MWSKETIKNKIYALVLIGIGALSILPENDATAFIFFCLIGVPLFFAKENWIMDGGGSDYVYEESRRESVRSASDCRRKESDGYRNSQAAMVWLCTYKLKQYGIDIEEWNKQRRD